MIRPQWIKFTWDLKNLPAFKDPMSRPLTLRQATKDEIEGVWLVVERAHMRDTGWNLDLKARLEEIDRIVHRGVEQENVEFWVLLDGSRIVGASGLVVDKDSPRQLATGICIFEEYHRRGAGTVLLYASLKHLAEKGLPQATVITRKGVAAARHLYPKFGSKSEEVPQQSDLPKLS